MKNKKIEIEISGKKYEIEFIRNIWFNRNKLRINDQIIKIENNFKNNYIGIDLPISLDDKEARFVRQGNFIDVSIDGKYINSGKEYKPQNKMPSWNWAFIIFNGLIPILTLGGAVPAMLAFLGMYSCTRISVNTSIKNKVICNLIITIGIYFLTYIFLNVMSAFI